MICLIIILPLLLRISRHIIFRLLLTFIIIRIMWCSSHLHIIRHLLLLLLIIMFSHFF